MSALWGNVISVAGVLLAALMGYIAASRREEQRARHRQAEQRQASAAARAIETTNRRDTALREVLGAELEARWRMLERLERLEPGHRAATAGSPGTAAAPRLRLAETAPAAAAAQAYAAALLALPDARIAAKAYYEATVGAQLAIDARDEAAMIARVEAWRAAFADLERTVAELADASD